MRFQRASLHEIHKHGLFLGLLMHIIIASVAVQKMET
jgi:hypothetical protein